MPAVVGSFVEMLAQLTLRLAVLQEEFPAVVVCGVTDGDGAALIDASESSQAEPGIVGAEVRAGVRVVVSKVEKRHEREGVAERVSLIIARARREAARDDECIRPREREWDLLQRRSSVRVELRHGVHFVFGQCRVQRTQCGRPARGLGGELDVLHLRKEQIWQHQRMREQRWRR